MINWIPQNTKYDFIGHRLPAFAVSIIIIIASIFLISTKGLNFGIDFTGGTLIEIQVEDNAPDLAKMRTELNGLGLGNISIQEFGAPNDLLIRMPEQAGDNLVQQEAIATVKNSLEDKYEEGIDYRRIEFVGPQVGEELKKKGLYAVIFSILGMLVYIWFRFEWQYGVSGVVALFHDSIATMGLFALMQWEFNLSTVAAILMIAGYSINDTVIVFDRIRENLRKYKKMPLEELLNISINDTLSRTIMTSGTTLLALIALWAFGGEVIRGFVNALIFGIFIGTHSSIFVASPLLLYMNIRRKKKDPMLTEAQADAP